jgi:CRISPR/Cas system-associated endoribonuclease Cas2
VAALATFQEKTVKKHSLVLAFLLAACGAAFAQAPAGDSTPRVDKREARQQARIQQGVHSGQLTPHEANRLEREQGHIAAAETRAKSDGKVTPRERARLTRMQNRASRDIRRQKHDAQHS